MIQNKIPEDSWLGIVWFETTAIIKKKLTHVVSQQVRNSLVDALPQTTLGGTCIACGIKTAIEVFLLLEDISFVYISTP